MRKCSEAVDMIENVLNEIDDSEVGCQPEKPQEDGLDIEEIRRKENEEALKEMAKFK